jgi:hypothetical protein
LNIKKRDHFEDLGVDGGTTKMDIKEMGWDGLSWVDPARDRDKQQALVKLHCTFRFLKMRGIS